MFFDERYHEAYKIVAIISLSYMIGKSTGIFNLAIYQDKKTSFLLIVNLVGAAINIGLNFILIRRFGVYGAAWATVITYTLIFTMSKYYANKCFYASFDKLLVIPIFFIIVIINMLFYYVEFNNVFSIVIKSLTIVLLALFYWYKYKNEILMLLQKQP